MSTYAQALHHALDRMQLPIQLHEQANQVQKMDEISYFVEALQALQEHWH
ncbi:hypothetical protein [Acinetobacter sp.]